MVYHIPGWWTVTGPPREARCAWAFSGQVRRLSFADQLPPGGHLNAQCAAFLLPHAERGAFPANCLRRLRPYIPRGFSLTTRFTSPKSLASSCFSIPAMQDSVWPCASFCITRSLLPLAAGQFGWLPQRAAKAGVIRARNLISPRRRRRQRRQRAAYL